MPKLRLPHHRLHVDAQVGPLHLLADLELSAGWSVLFGPSGSGKSSLLRAACGLLHEGNIGFQRCASPPREIDTAELPCVVGLLWTSLSGVPTHRRNLGYAPQGTVLFPHLSVRENVAFAADTPLVDELLDLFQLTRFARRYPSALSGGERQRVALARAFAVPAPSLILLDEPFTGLDRSLRDELVPAMAAHLADRAIPVLSVTHDVEEALLVNAEVIRIAAGRITAQGPVREVLAPEVSRMREIFNAQRV